MNRSVKARQVGVAASWLCAVMLGIGSMGSSLAWADESSSESMKADIEILKKRLAELETTLAEQDVLPPTSGEGAFAGIIQLPSGLQGVRMGGYTDTSYTYNFNEPKPSTNTLRAFDTRAGDFMINQAKLFIDKPVSAESPVGFRTDLVFGADAEILGSVSTGLGRTDDELDIQQAFVEYLAPVGNGLGIKAGKFTTMHGAEVTESKDNWNFSRSFLYTWAEPLSHTGLRLNYPWTSTLTTMFGVSNGWDVVDDNNRAKSLEFGLSATPMEHVTINSAYMIGAEQTNDSKDHRNLWTLVLGYDPIEQLHLKFAYDYGWEQDAVSEEDGGNASWSGFALYAKYDLADAWSIANRFEMFFDQDNVRTSAAVPGRTVADLDLWEWTLTNEWKINSHLIARLEYRLDKGSEKVFPHHDGFASYQNTIGVEFITPF